MRTRSITQADEALRLIERDEILNAVAKAAGAERGIFLEPCRAVRIRPRAAVLESLRIVPMKERDEWADAVFKQSVDELIVEGDAFFVDLACAVGEKARPREGKTIVLDAELRHQLNIVTEAVVMVAGDIAGIAMKNFSVPMGERIPDRSTLSSLKSSTLDLVGRGCRAPDEVLAKAHVGEPPYSSLYSIS